MAIVYYVSYIVGSRLQCPLWVITTEGASEARGILPSTRNLLSSDTGFPSTARVPSVLSPHLHLHRPTPFSSRVTSRASETPLNSPQTPSAMLIECSTLLTSRVFPAQMAPGKLCDLLSHLKPSLCRGPDGSPGNPLWNAGGANKTCVESHHPLPLCSTKKHSLALELPFTITLSCFC